MSQIQQVVNSIQDEFRFNDKGQAFVSIRGAARLAGVDARAIGRALGDGVTNPRQLTEYLMEQGIEAGSLESFAQSGIPDTVLSLILEYYGYEAQERYRTQEAKACFRAFCAIGIRSWLQEALGYEEEAIEQPQAIPYYYQRLRLFQERTGRIPEGYFCIFEETLPLVGQLERHGYNIPDDAVIDSSIGKLFCGYMRSEYNLEPNDYCLKYPHWFPGQPRPVPANLYPIDWLIVFRKWFNSRYYNLHLPKYFKGRKDVGAIEAVNRFLGLLPRS